MELDVVIPGIASLLCIAALLCAIPFAISRRRRSLRMCGVVVATLGIAIVTDVIAGAALDREPPAMAAASTPPATRPPTASPTLTPTAPPTPTRTPETRAVASPPAETLRNFSVYWGDIVRVSAAALKAHDRAGEDLRIGNIERAAGELKYCQETASGIASYSSYLQISIDNGSDLEFLAAIKKVGDGLQYGCKSARSYLETNAASDFEDAKSRFADVVDGIVQAETLARAKYQRLGGNPDSLLSFKTALR